MNDIGNSGDKSRKMRSGWKSLLLPVAGIILGTIGGYIYYIKIGCQGGTCPITSNPALTMLWGAILGFLVFDMFRKKPAKSEQKNPGTEN